MVSVTYHCPRCGVIAELERDPYLADKAVTPYPFEGWEYVSPNEGYENADGVRFVCGGTATLPDEDGCGEPFYLSFVRFKEGEEIEPEPPAEFVEIDADPSPPGPRGPSGSN